MSFNYKLKTLYKLNEKLKIIPENDFGTEFGIHEGFHAYVCEGDAFREYNYHIKGGRYKIGVYKCRIPKGASFIRGWFCDRPSIASDAIEILEEVPIVNS